MYAVLNRNICMGFEARFSYKLLCIQVREVGKTFLFNLHISTIEASNKTMCSAVGSQRHRISFLKGNEPRSHVIYR